MLGEALAPSSFAGVLTACGVLVTAIGGLILSITVLIPNLRTVKKIEHSVNQYRTNSANFQAALIRTIIENGLEVPVDQSGQYPGPPEATK